VPGANEPGGEPGFAYAGVGSGDETAAHGERVGVGGRLPKEELRTGRW
jgi:hypothetical protein